MLCRLLRCWFSVWLLLFDCWVCVVLWCLVCCLIVMVCGVVVVNQIVWVIENVDVVLIGGGIMSVILGILLYELQLEWKIVVFE